MKTLPGIHDSSLATCSKGKGENPKLENAVHDNLNNLVTSVRNVYRSGRTRCVKFRLKQLKSLQRLYNENTDKMMEAVMKDLRKPNLESDCYEIVFLQKDVKYAIKNLKKLTRNIEIPRNIIALSDDLYIRNEPYGVVLIISPWNYPFQLSFLPFCAALFAGNCIILKPSELSPCCSQLMTSLIPKYLDEECYRVVQGGPEISQALLQERFDYIFYTGSHNIARIVHSAANKYLTPCTLELGGKCPVYMDNTVNYKMAAERIMWGKGLALGQTCAAPDYILCTKEVEEKFLPECKKALRKFFGENPQETKDLSRIIAARHFARLRKLLGETKGKIAVGGSVDEYDLWIEPTIVVDVKMDDSLMQEEIFGPILPIITVKSEEEAVQFMNERPDPLTLYIFSKNQKAIKRIMDNVQSGGVSVNEIAYHISIAELPFGGVGASGTGQYHGKYSFQTFSRPRGVTHRSFNYFDNNNVILCRYPPYTTLKNFIVRFGISNYHVFYINIFKAVPYIFCILLGMFISFLAEYTTTITKL